MLKKILKNINTILLFILCNQTLAENGLFFNISATGEPANVNITLCLNGKGPISCQTYDVSSLTLDISTAIPNHRYSSAGIKVNTPGYKLGAGCTPTYSDYCLFSVSDTNSQTITLLVNGPLTISPSSLPAAELNTPYSQTVTASGGVAPYIYAVTAGSLPTGLSLNVSSGVISGIPTNVTTYNFTITANDAIEDSGSKDYSIVVSGPLSISPSSLPAAALNTTYSQTVTASDGVAPYTYAVTSGSLPTGLSLNVSTGVISGTPTIPGEYTFTITATDSLSITGSISYSMTVGVIAYILNNNSNNVSYCFIDNDGTFRSCNHTASGSTYNYGLTINPNKTYGYITHYGSGALVSYCPINSDGTFGTCQSTGNNMLSAIGIAINSTNTYAYIANSASVGTNAVVYCPINSNASFGTCLSSGPSFLSPLSITLNSTSTYAYVVNGNGHLVFCHINNDGTLASCSNTGSNFNTPTFITFNPTGSIAYVTNFNTNQVTFCTVNGDGTLASCALTGNLLGPAFGIAINQQGTIAYITSRDTNQVSYCPINDNGSLGTCNTTGSGFSGPANIVLKNP